MNVSVAEVLGAWQWAPLPVTAIVATGAAYVAGVRALTGRADRWPWGRSISFFAGLGVLAWALMGGVAVYDDILFSAHMVQHMVLAMAVPILLALGAPITLALRTLPPGLRGLLLRLLATRAVRILTNPLVAWVLFVTAPFILYFTAWYPATLDNEYLHQAMHLHFLLVGCLFFWPLLGLDPLPNRVGHPARMLLALTMVPFHAFFGLAVMSGTQLIAEEHYLGLGWTPTQALEDQHLGGGILWAAGDLIGFVIMSIIFWQWVAASEREAKREDRRLDRLERLDQRERTQAQE